jgi:hypothetical protein
VVPGACEIMSYVRKVVCAAIKLQSGLIVCGARHFDDVMRAQIRACGHSHVGGEQGFIDQRGVFLTRQEARQVAEASGQITRSVGGDANRLYSENLY